MPTPSKLLLAIAVSLVNRAWAEPIVGEHSPLVLITGLVGVCLALSAWGAWNAWRRHQLEQRQLSMQEQLGQLESLINAIPDPVWIKDVQGRYIKCNAAMERLFDTRQSDMRGKTDALITEPDTVDQFRQNDLAALKSSTPMTFEESVAIAGQPLVFEATKAAFRDTAGYPIGVLGIAHDITRRKQAEQHLLRSNRALRMLSDVNQILIRSTSEENLLNQLCDILIEKGGYRMAWVGYALNDPAKSVHPVSHAGCDEGYLARKKVTWGDGKFSHGPTGTAINTRHPVINRDTEHDALMTPWRQEAIERGYRSSIALPLLTDAQAFGCLNIYASEIDAFHEEEVTLLTELADDLAFGIQTLRNKAAHERAEKTLAAQKLVLEMVASGHPLADTLSALILQVEALVPTMTSSILLVDGSGQHLRHGAAPSLPPAYIAAVDGVRIGPKVGSCGTAAFTRQPVIVEDIQTSPLWQDYRELAQAHGLRACWSTPFFDQRGKLLGTFASYFNEPRLPDREELELIEMATQTAAIAVAREQEEEALRHSEASLAAAQERARLGSWETDMISGQQSWSAEMYRLLELDPEKGPPNLSEFLDLLHPEDRPLLFGRGKLAVTQLEDSVTIECRSNPERGPLRYFSIVISPVTQGDTLIRIDGTMLDVTERKAQEARIEQLAFYDTLTGLPHRTLFVDRLNQNIATAERNHAQMALFFMDLNRFKEINDSQGHNAGDEVLREVARRLHGVLRQNETLARLGGDEFTIIVCDCDKASASRVATRIMAALDKPVIIQGRSFNVGASLGIALYPVDGTNSQTLLSRADMAMYRAKQDGLGHCFYSPDMGAKLDNRLALAQGLERALTEGHLELYYQPQISLATGQLIGAEALLRWRDPEKGWISPADFIPVAEERGMMNGLGNWVLREACRQLKNWALENRPFPGKLAVNISAKQLSDSQFVTSVLAALSTYDIAPDSLELELTESALMADASRAIELLAELKHRGLALAIDDFGTGYSSLVYLKQFPADKLKIDMSFIRDMLSDQNDYAIVTTIIAMARHLGLKTIAEGVEHAAQAEALATLGCDEVQGYYYGRPEAAESFAQRWLPGKVTAA